MEDKYTKTLAWIITTVLELLITDTETVRGKKPWIEKR